MQEAIRAFSTRKVAGRVALCVVTLCIALAGGRSAGAQPLAAGAVELSGTSFVPETITIDVGETVQWTKTDGFHNVQAEDGSFVSGEPTTDPFQFSHTFTTAGTYKYFCRIHGDFGMRGTVIVEGAASIQNLYLPLIIQ